MTDVCSIRVEKLTLSYFKRSIFEEKRDSSVVRLRILNCSMSTKEEPEKLD
jgi:hypothetical protein